MASWIVGDIHGCAEELAQLIEELELGPEDRLISVGDLFHRGPDPVGVMELLEGCGARFVLGNHERTVLRRARLAPELADGSDRPSFREVFPELDPEDLAGDGNRPMAADRGRLADLLHFLQRHDGYFLEDRAIPGAGRTGDDRSWCVVHAGVIPGRNPARMTPGELTRLRRLEGRRRGLWYESYRGPTLVLFGHTPFREPHFVSHGGQLVALGLDTGCVYGGSLTAYSPELGVLRSVAAKGTYAGV